MTNPSNPEVAAPQAHETPRTLLQRLRIYFRQCAPHIAEREGPKLIGAAADEIERLQSALCASEAARVEAERHLERSQSAEADVAALLIRAESAERSLQEHLADPDKAFRDHLAAHQSVASPAQTHTRDEAGASSGKQQAGNVAGEAPKVIDQTTATPECHGLDTPERVCFYEQDFYVLSNLSAFSLMWMGFKFDTAEAVYHWHKFPHDTALRSSIRLASSAHEAFKAAERFREKRRPDWDRVKVSIMREILRAKVDQHEYVRRKLLATGDRELVENSWRDAYWGWGLNRDGQNMLGKLWMEIRAELRTAERCQDTTLQKTSEPNNPSAVNQPAQVKGRET